MGLRQCYTHANHSVSVSSKILLSSILIPAGKDMQVLQGFKEGEVQLGLEHLGYMLML